MELEVCEGRKRRRGQSNDMTVSIERAFQMNAKREGK